MSLIWLCNEFLNLIKLSWDVYFLFKWPTLGFILSKYCRAGAAHPTLNPENVLSLLFLNIPSSHKDKWILPRAKCILTCDFPEVIDK